MLNTTLHMNDTVVVDLSHELSATMIRPRNYKVQSSALDPCSGEHFIT